MNNYDRRNGVVSGRDSPLPSHRRSHEKLPLGMTAWFHFLNFMEIANPAKERK